MALTIGQVAKAARVNVETLRYYERRGLVPKPPRSPSLYRHYPEDTVPRVQFVKHAQELGFSLREIRGLLSLRATPKAGCDGDIITRFCHYVHFFRSRDGGEAWIAKAPGTFLLTLDEAFELARLKNQAQFGSLLRNTTGRGRIVSDDLHPLTPEITLVYDADCPNVLAARAALREALHYSGLDPRWIEYDRTTPSIPERLLRFGSPTILVDGEDVADESAIAAAACCRVYPAGGGLRGVPPVAAIVAAIDRRRGAAPEMGEVR